MTFRVRSSRLARQDVGASGPAVDRNVARIAKLEAQQIQARGLSQRIALAVTRAAGTSTFALAHLVWFACWIAINTGWVRRVRPFDPFPFNLLTMVVSLEAIFITIGVMISQNRMTRLGDRRAHLDLQINLLAEHEVTRLVAMVAAIAERLGVGEEAGAEVHELKQDVAPEVVLDAIDQAP